MNKKYDVAIIGCGVVGAASAYLLSRFDCKIAVLEAENDVAMGTSRANSGILHGGYDPVPGTLAASLNVRGYQMAVDICKKLDVPLKLCGSLVLAFTEEDLLHIRELYTRGIANGVSGLKIIDSSHVLEMEPNVNPDVLGALYCPHSGVIDPWEYTLAMAETAVVNGVEMHFNSKVTDLEKTEAAWMLSTTSGVFEADYVINAAGLGVEELHGKLAPVDFITKPAKGEYYLLDKTENGLVSHVIFQCPNASGKGVLVSPTAHGNIIVGPNAVACDMTDTSVTREGLDYVASTAKRSVPSLNVRKSIRNFAGVRANTSSPDFIIREVAPKMVELAGIKSPGLSSAPAIAETAVKLLRGSGFDFAEKPDFTDSRRHLRFAELSPADKKKVIAKNPDYAHIICRCETISKGEILDALRSPIPPVSLDGIKRRAGTGLGRCQGGFCGPRIIEIMSEELGISPLDIPKDFAEGRVLAAKINETEAFRSAEKSVSGKEND